MDKSTLTEKEQKFCLIYSNGPAPYNGNDVRCYQLVFNESTSLPRGKEEVEISLKAKELLQREDVKKYLESLDALNIVNAETLRPRITQTLLKIMDECSTLRLKDRWDVEVSPAALRAVAVNAASKLTDMYGIKEDIAHKIQIEGADGDGITFNLIAPQPTKKDDELIGE
jgi:NADPH-dependent 7-cyano-7-deazaguanine reductase QueF-like protein